MEGNRRVEKRGAKEIIEEPEDSSKKQKVPALASAIVEALNLDSFQRLCSSIEPLFRRIVSEEVERAFTKLERPKLTERSSPPKIGGRKLQLHFRSRLPPHLFTGAKIEGDQGTSIDIVLLDALTGTIIQSGPESIFKLSIVVLEGNFNDNVNDKEWSIEQFESFIVKEREGKRPLLNGDSQVTLKDGVGTLGELSFTDNSSWIRSRKFRLGVKVEDGLCEGIRVLEAKSEAFAVKDHRGELYKKHYPPALSDEVWRLDRIAKDGALHKKLINANVITVEDFLRFLVRDQRKLRNILGSGMSNKMWDNTVEHAKTCVLNSLLYVYYNSDHTTTITGAVFNSIYEFMGIINANGQFLSVECISHDHKMSVDLLVKRAYENWNDVIEYDSGVQPLSSAATFSSVLKNQLNVTPLKHSSYDYYLEEEEEEDIRAKSSEILRHEGMQYMLKSFASADLSGIVASSSDQASNSSCDFSNLDQSQYFQSNHKKKAAVCWLKLKAAFRWGIFVRKRTAERRATMVQLGE